MGIQGLLPMLKEISVHGHISDFKGKRLAVDAYVWLHKGAFGCAEQLVKGQKTTKFVDYAMHRVRLLRHFGITPYIVFDGGPLPAKKGTEVSRAKSRADSLAKAQSLESQGRMNEARECYTKCLDITPEMAFQLIKALRAEGVEYVVAPYEADAQLCFLEREGYVDGIITEDSDLLVFGCRQVIFKLDNNGQCVSINRNHFQTLTEFPMHGWTDLEFRRMAMLSGCDYLPSIPGIGIKTAHKLLRRYKTVEKLLQSLRMEGAHNIPADYNALFSQAELAFIFQRVYHPALRRLVPLNDLPEGGLAEEDQKWVGLDVDVQIARGMARGDVHPETRVPIEDLWPDYKPQPRNVGRGAAGTSSAALLPAKVTAGPMDAFIKRTRSDPLPKPLGVASSGPSRISDIHFYSGTQSQPELANGAVKKSKFFGGRKSAVKQLEEAVAAVKEEITWEQSDGPDVETQLQDTLPHQPHSSPPPLESLLSPQVSSLRHSSPGQLDNGHVLTSPPLSRCSTPTSSPLAQRSYNEDPFVSPTRSKRSSQPIPSPPAKRRRTASLSPMPVAKPLTDDALVDETQRSDIPDVIAETPIVRTRLTSRGSIRTSHSSPSTNFSQRAVISTSSDGLEEEEVVTPILNLERFRRGAPKLSQSLKHPTSSDSQEDSYQVQRSSRLPSQIHDSVEVDDLEDVEDPDDSDRERQRVEADRKRVKVIAEGWKKKYAFDGAMAFPKPRSTRTSKGPDEKAYPRDTILSPPRKALRAKEINVDENASTRTLVTDKPLARKIAISKSEVVEHATPRLFNLDRPEASRRKSEGSTPLGKVRLQDKADKTPVRSPLSSHDPGKIFGSLEKFRYTGKRIPAPL